MNSARSLRLVIGVRRSCAIAREHRGAVADVAVEPLAHAVEGDVRLPRLLRSALRQRLEALAASEPVGGVGEPAERPAGPADAERADDADREGRDQERGEEGAAERRHRRTVGKGVEPASVGEVDETLHPGRRPMVRRRPGGAPFSSSSSALRGAAAPRRRRELTRTSSIGLPIAAARSSRSEAVTRSRRPEAVGFGSSADAEDRRARRREHALCRCGRRLFQKFDQRDEADEEVLPVGAAERRDALAGEEREGERPAR